MNSLPSTRTDSLEAAHCGCGHDHGPAAGASEKTGHGHDHGPVTSIGPRLLAGVAINLVICISQLVGGLLANSLGLLSDALHNLSDVVSLALSYGTHRAGQPPSTPRRTFAYNRVEVLVALFNAAALLSSNWLTEQELEDGLALVQLYPGPIGVDLVAYVGFKLRGFRGPSWRRRRSSCLRFSSCSSSRRSTSPSGTCPGSPASLSGSKPLSSAFFSTSPWTWAAETFAADLRH
ncbi:MAG: cation transporter [Deltaproteobacteria bacterium]|nr:cation transporter [Deltaproteobacteria bacterium]